MTSQYIGTGRSYAPYHGEGLPTVDLAAHREPLAYATAVAVATVIGELVQVMASIEDLPRARERIENLQSLAKALRGE